MYPNVREVAPSSGKRLCQATLKLYQSRGDAAKEPQL